MSLDKGWIEHVSGVLKPLADKARSDGRDVDSIAQFDRWLELHRHAIRLLIEAEKYKCPERTQILFYLSNALDENVLPVDFYKRLVLLHRKVTLDGNRRKKNQFRDALIQAQFKSFREGFPWEEDYPENGKFIFIQLNYKDSLTAVADFFNLSEKSIENIIQKQLGDVDWYVNVEKGKDFERFWIEAMKIEAKENKIP